MNQRPAEFMFYHPQNPSGCGLPASVGLGPAPPWNTVSATNPNLKISTILGPPTDCRDCNLRIFYHNKCCDDDALRHKSASVIMTDSDSHPSRLDDSDVQSESDPPEVECVDGSLTHSLPPVHSSTEDLETLILGVPLKASDRPGSMGRLAEYEILNHVGRGGMGMVLRAFDKQLHRNVAIKVMSPDLMSSEQARERFFREARSAAGINHPNVVTIHAVSQFEGTPFLVMEFVDGQSLQKRIKADAPMDLLDILRISSQIANGLAAAHRHGIVHRDIKPANIMLEDSIERVKITDFGLARVTLERSDLTSLGNIVGTPSFMSPEQVEGLNLDHRSDLFSLGCVMYAMISGHSPFRSSNAIATARKVLSEPHTPLTEVANNVPKYLREIIDHLLEKSPDDRIQTAEELAQILTQRLAEANRSSGSKISSQTVRRVKSRKRNRLKVVSAAIVAIVGAVLFQGFGFPEAEDNGVTGANGTTGAGSAVSDSPTVADFLSDGVLVVAADGSGEFRNLAEAVSYSQPGCKISVIDDSTYSGQLLFSGGNVKNVHLEATNGATLTATRLYRLLCRKA
jgi:hypothetical protein